MILIRKSEVLALLYRYTKINRENLGIYGNGFSTCAKNILGDVNNLTEIDSKEFEKLSASEAQWIKPSGIWLTAHGYECSACGRKVKAKENFCPSCGCVMR